MSICNTKTLAVSTISIKLQAQRGCPTSKLNSSACHGIKLICALSRMTLCKQFNVSTEPLQLTHTKPSLKALLNWYCFVWQMAAYFTFLKTVRGETETEEH